MSQNFCTNVCKTIQSYIFTCFWPLSLKLGKLFNFKAIFPAASVNFRLLNKSEVESCKKFVEGLISNFIYGLNFVRDISQMKQSWRLFFHILQYYTGVFRPIKCLQIYCQVWLWKLQLSRRLFFPILQYFTGVFTPSVCKFIAKRDYENHNSGILAWVTSFTGEDTLRLIDLNEFVFGANLRVDILHGVVVWQWAKRRAAP